MSTQLQERVQTLSAQQEAQLKHVRELFAVTEGDTFDKKVNALLTVKWVFDGYATFAEWVDSRGVLVIGKRDNGTYYVDSVRACAAAWMRTQDITLTSKQASRRISGLTLKGAKADEAIRAAISAADCTSETIAAEQKKVEVANLAAKTFALVNMTFSDAAVSKDINLVTEAVAAGADPKAALAHAKAMAERYNALVASLEA